MGLTICMQFALEASVTFRKMTQGLESVLNYDLPLIGKYKPGIPATSHCIADTRVAGSQLREAADSSMEVLELRLQTLEERENDPLFKFSMRKLLSRVQKSQEDAERLAESSRCTFNVLAEVLLSSIPVSSVEWAE